MEKLVRVNTRKEKKAYETLELALGVVGLTINDLKKLSEIIETNRVLEFENLRLKNELAKRNENKNTFNDYLTKKEELK